MEKMLLGIFQSEVKKQIEFALVSVNYINAHLKNPNSGDISQLWYFIHNFLNASANVSKLLWGSNEKINHTRRDLRDSLNVKDKEDSALFSRELRNSFEHYDDRLETWYNESERKNFVDSNVGPTNMIGGIDPTDYLRNYDTSQNAITFRGNVYEVQPIVDELMALYETVSSVVNK